MKKAWRDIEEEFKKFKGSVLAFDALTAKLAEPDNALTAAGVDVAALEGDVLCAVTRIRSWRRRLIKIVRR